MPPTQQPQIILLKEGTDTSQGTPQLVSNINACMALADTVRTTLGPRGMDKLIHDDKVGAAGGCYCFLGTAGAATQRSTAHSPHQGVWCTTVCQQWRQQ